MRQFKVGEDYRQEFDNLSDFVDFLNRTPANGKAAHAATSHGPERWGEWYGTESFQEAEGLLVNGWAKGAERIAEIARPIFDQITRKIMRPQPQFEITGDTVDIGKYLTGEPENMIVFRDSEFEAEAHGKIVTIAVDLACSGFFSPEDFFRRGAMVAVLVDTLEAAGRRAEVNVYVTIGNHGNKLCTTEIKLKRADQTMSAEQMAFALAHASMYRRLLFGAQERTPASVVNSYGFHRHGSYGHFNSRCDLREVEADVKIGNMVMGRVRDIHGWVREQLTKQGVILEEG